MYLIRKCYFWDDGFIPVSEWVADDFDSAYKFARSISPNSEIKEDREGFYLEYEGLCGAQLSEAELVTFKLCFYEVQNVNEIDT